MTDIKKIIFSEAQNTLIVDAYENGTYAINELAKMLGASRAAIKRAAKELGYDTPVKRKNSAGVKVILSKGQVRKIRELYLSEFHSVEEISILMNLSEDKVRDTAQAYGLVKVQKVSWLTKDRKMEIRNWDGKKSISQLAREYGCTMEAIRKYMKKHGIDTTLHTQREDGTKNEKRVLTEEELKILSDSKLARWEVAELLNVSTKWVTDKRREFFGDNIFLRKDYTREYSQAEKQVADILLDLDFAFFDHYELLGYNVDFYMGRKLIIEVQGDYFHSKEETIVADEKKYDFFTSKGYSILYVQEHELKDQEAVYLKIDEFMTKASHARNSMTNTLVNASKSGVAKSG